MCLRDYFHAKAVTLCFIGMAMVALAVFMAAAGSDWRLALMAEVFAAALVCCWLACSYLWERNRLQKLEQAVAQLEETYLLGEVLPKPVSAVEKRYYYVMQSVSRSAVGAVEDARREKEEYQDYLESWIHEIKTPLTACSLILDNDGDARKLRRELKRADNLTENILYYARMRTVEKDTEVREISVASVMERAVKSQMELLIAARISVEVTGDFQVYTDEKSLLFMLKQLLINSGKYCPGRRVKMSAADGTITVEDNGIGIPSHEVGRVTDRGFSGTNGRALGKSTGMGLYMVKELCDRLGIGLSIESEQGKYTRISLSFEKK